jgi:uncharacterized protein YcbK (DUF882 family)
MSSGPSLHLSWNELGCWNRGAKPWGKYAPGEFISAYPQQWRESRAQQVATNFERVRELLGNVPIAIVSAYRTPEYNAHVGGAAHSQHPQGRALDIVHSHLKAREVYAMLLEMVRLGELPLIGGLGSYQTFVHMDVRARINGHVATWIDH